MKMSKKEKTVLTKTQKRSLFRWFLNGGASLNYERMMSMAYNIFHVAMVERKIIKEIRKDWKKISKDTFTVLQLQSIYESVCYGS